MHDLLLRPGSQDVVIYGDGSFSADLLVGAWASHVPSFGLQAAGSGFGPSEGHFEFGALVEGIRAVANIDHTTRPLHLHTDSEFVIAVLRFLASRADLPARKSFESIRALYGQATQLIGTRPVRWSRADTKSAFHRICHQSARCALRKEIQNRLAADAVMALRYEEHRREEFLRERERIVQRMRRIENKLRSCDARIVQYATNI